MDESNGLSLPGRDRLARVERSQEHTAEMLGELNNRVGLILERQGDHTRRLDAHDEAHRGLANEIKEKEKAHEKRHRGLDWRWYGIIAGLTSAAAIVIYKGGAP